MSTTNRCCPSDYRTITLIEPDNLVLAATSSGSSDQSLDERGEVDLEINQGVVGVAFITPKAGDYRFEYLYIDALGETIDLHPVHAGIVPITQTPYGFTVKLAGVEVQTGYVLRWRVVVVAISGELGAGIDSPEAFRVQLPLARVVVVPFVNPRSNTDYGFSEFRVENLTDPDATQRIILPQVVGKTFTNFTVGLSPIPDTNHYFLVARTP